MVMDSGQIPYSVLHLENWVVIDVRWWHCHGLLTADTSLSVLLLVTHKLAVKGTDEIYLYPGSTASRDTVLCDGIFLTQVMNNRKLEKGRFLWFIVISTLEHTHQMCYHCGLLSLKCTD